MCSALNTHEEAVCAEQLAAEALLSHPREAGWVSSRTNTPPSLGRHEVFVLARVAATGKLVEASEEERPAAVGVVLIMCTSQLSIKSQFFFISCLSHWGIWKWENVRLGRLEGQRPWTVRWQRCLLWYVTCLCSILVKSILRFRLLAGSEVANASRKCFWCFFLQTKQVQSDFLFPPRCGLVGLFSQNTVSCCFPCFFALLEQY